MFGAAFHENDIESIEGETIEAASSSKWPEVQKWFCKKCGTTVHWVNPTYMPGMRMVSIGCFADPEFPAPSVAVYTKYRHDWCGTFPGATDFEGLPE